MILIDVCQQDATRTGKARLAHFLSCHFDQWSALAPGATIASNHILRDFGQHSMKLQPLAIGSGRVQIFAGCTLTISGAAPSEGIHGFGR